MSTLFNLFGRSPDEPHRAATTLELFYDLVYVVAIALVAAQLHHGLNELHFAHAIMSFLQVFFCIWWAWMGFTWFASAFDVDDTFYRIKVLVQMVGALVIAVGVPDVFEHHDWSRVAIGYCIMRLGLVALWYRAMRSHAVGTALHTLAKRNIIGILLAQCAWVVIVFSHQAAYLFWPMVVVELLIPMWANKAGINPWHPHHIAERYGLLLIIVLGESILSLSHAINATDSLNDLNLSSVSFIVSAVAMLFVMWWLYFFKSASQLLQSRDSNLVFLWGYGHFFVYASATAVGAALSAMVDVYLGKANIPSPYLGLILSVPLAIYLLSLWYCQERIRFKGSMLTWVYPIVALLMVGTAWLPFSVVWMSVGLTLLLVLRHFMVETNSGVLTRHAE